MVADGSDIIDKAVQLWKQVKPMVRADVKSTSLNAGKPANTDDISEVSAGIMIVFKLVHPLKIPIPDIDVNIGKFTDSRATHPEKAPPP